jgi:hypothetical protein
MVFNATINNISAILGRSALLVEETGIPRETHRPATNHCKLYHIMLYLVHLAWVGLEITKLVVIGTDCIGSCKSTIRSLNFKTSDPQQYKLDSVEQYVCSLLDQIQQPNNLSTVSNGQVSIFIYCLSLLFSY